MMVDQFPILIAGPPRAGTTMLAGLIAPHDIWVGRARTTWFPGTNPPFPAENQDIKDLMKQEAKRCGYRNWDTPLPEQSEDWRYGKEQIEMFVPDNQRWLVKTTWTVIWWKFWNKAYPEARWILPYRELNSVMDSISRHPGMCRRPKNTVRRFIQAIHERQRELSHLVNYSHEVDVYKVSQRNGKEIESLFEFMGIPCDWLKINEWIKPGRLKK